MKSKEQIRTKLDESESYVNKILDQVGDRWEHQIYPDGLQWNARQVLIHITEADRGHNFQAMNIAEGKDVIPADFDVERYNARTTEKFATKTVAEARAELAANRKALLEWLDGLDEAKLDREGRHASGTTMTVRNIIRMQALHAQGHARDIARVLGITVG